MVKLLNEIPGLKCPTPKGAFYAFPDISGIFGKNGNGKTIENADQFTDYLLESVHVAVVPGTGFGAPNCIRLSYATSMANIEKGLERIRQAVNKLSS